MHLAFARTPQGSLPRCPKDICTIKLIVENRTDSAIPISTFVFCHTSPMSPTITKGLAASNFLRDKARGLKLYCSKGHTVRELI